MDGKWHKVYIPLTSFVEGGSWDNTWFNPIGAFDWKAVDRFDLVAEEMSLADKSLWFDNIQICNMDTASVYNSSTYTDLAEMRLNHSTLIVYPNPVLTATTISYTVVTDENVDISIYNLSGQKIKTLLNSKQVAGNYSISWNADTEEGRKVSHGVYFCRMKFLGQDAVSKIIVI